jgi:N-acetyl-anhydromuramyl-L-alanine amidase AmpD
VIPADAKIEAVLGDDVVIYDVAGLLPLNRLKKQRTRDTAGICRVYAHHSGALGPAGFDGALASAKFVVSQRGFPSAAYTYWLSYEPDRDASGRIVVYRLNPDERRSWHTGGAANDHGVAICWQGNLRARKPSAEQYLAANALMQRLAERHRLDPQAPLVGHADSERFGGHPKPTCPGPHVEAWIAGWRGVCAA